MRQLLYVSTSVRPIGEDDLTVLLDQSRHNNALFGVTGFLWSDGRRFLQVLEGPDDSIAETYERIANDDRHRDLLVLRDERIDDRQFGDWSMAYRRSYETEDEYDMRIRQLLTDVTGSARAELNELIGFDDTALNTATFHRSNGRRITA